MRSVSNDLSANRAATRHVSLLVRAGLSAVVGVLLLAVVRLATSTDPAEALQRSAEVFVSLALRLAVIPGHEDEVDDYFGSGGFRPVTHTVGEAEDIDALLARTEELLARVQREQLASPSPRGTRLAQRVEHFANLLAVIAEPRRWSFDDEARRVYGTGTPEIDPQRAQAALAGLDAALPGQGSVSHRVASFRRQFVVPAERRKAVFERALQECRARTQAHWRLPAGERVELQWTREVGSAWHHYQGDGVSTVQMNPASVALIGSALDVACHEAYPGHHAQFLMMELRADPAGLALEDQLVLLRSPASMLREGAASYGVELAFPVEDRIAFDREVLFPMAGLDPEQAELYEHVHHLVGVLSAAAAPILRDYHDGAITRTNALLRLEAEAQIASPAALLQFTDEFGSYVLGYTAVRDRVREFVRVHMAETGQDAWAVLRDLVSGPNVTALAVAEN